MSTVRLFAPLAGWATSLDDVPDPVFAERMMGDGVAIDPLEGLLRSPCDGTVIAIAPTGHSVTMLLANGAELLIHIGLETVGLVGRGFTPKVQAGSALVIGTPMIAFDLDIVAEGAKSLVTPIVVANEGYVLTVLAQGSVAAGDPLFDVTAIGADAAEPADIGNDTAQCDVTVPMANGIHARPAAKIAAALKPFAAEVVFAAHDRTANARSTVALLALGLRRGDTIRVTARGADARAAVTAVAVLIEGGMGETGAPPSPDYPASAPQEANGPVFRGVRAAPGLAIGPVVQFRPADAVLPERGAGVAQERQALDAALATLSDALARTGTGPAAEIAAAHRALLEDPELIEGARAEIAAGASAGHAWRSATRAHAGAIRATGDALLIERIADLIDVERRLVAVLLGEDAPAMPALPPGAILIADELLPSQFLALDTVALGGICTARGGPTSHVAILAASAGVPMLVAAGAAVLAIVEGRTVILDADSASLDSDPADETIERLSVRIAGSAERQAADRATAHLPCVMADGKRIEIFANLGSTADAARAVSLGAEGCGLLRTEFLFLDRAEAPTESEQRESYAAVARALGGRPLIVRTLDIGGDKPVPYLPFPHEDNPALGNRGVRLSLARPDLLATQFRAILAAVPAGQCRIMVPMIADRDELRAVRTIYDEAVRAVGAGSPPLGVMIETPAAALLADSIAAEADFLSVGTNDLTQYALAADRGNPALAARIDALHPAVLRLIAQAAAGARRHGRLLGICGGVASDPLAAAILIGLGATELSATPAAIPALKAVVRGLRFEQCCTLAARALAAGTAEEVRALVGEQN